MTYEKIRIEAMKEKKSHFHQRMKINRFGNFAVCQSDKVDAIIVDENMAEIVAHRRWCEDSNGYVVANLGGHTVRLHDFVMAFDIDHKPEGMFVDHINRDKKDNRIANLRLVTPIENTTNKALHGRNKTGVTGVCRSKSGRYRAYAKYNGKQVSLGTFDTLEEARMARVEAEQRLGYKSRPETVKEICNLAFLAELEESE